MLQSTVTRYLTAYLLFEKFVLAKYSITLTAQLPPEVLDRLLVSYTQTLYDYHKGRMKHLAVEAKLGIYQELGHRYKSALPDSNRCLTAWQRLVPPVSHTPLPMPLKDVFAALLTIAGQ